MPVKKPFGQITRAGSGEVLSEFQPDAEPAAQFTDASGQPIPMDGGGSLSFAPAAPAPAPEPWDPINFFTQSTPDNPKDPRFEPDRKAWLDSFARGYHDRKGSFNTVEDYVRWASTLPGSGEGTATYAKQQILEYMPAPLKREYESIKAKRAEHAQLADSIDMLSYQQEELAKRGLEGYYWDQKQGRWGKDPITPTQMDKAMELLEGRYNVAAELYHTMPGKRWMMSGDVLNPKIMPYDPASSTQVFHLKEKGWTDITPMIQARAQGLQAPAAAPDPAAPVVEENEVIIFVSPGGKEYNIPRSEVVKRGIPKGFKRK